MHLTTLMQGTVMKLVSLRKHLHFSLPAFVFVWCFHNNGKMMQYGLFHLSISSIRSPFCCNYLIPINWGHSFLFGYCV